MKYGVLWLIGVPVPVLIVLYLSFTEQICGIEPARAGRSRGWLPWPSFTRTRIAISRC
jgi:hypothetical protein